MKKCSLFFMMTSFVLCLAVMNGEAEVAKLPVKVKPPGSSAPKVITPPPSPAFLLTLNAPAAGENWGIGSTHDITWTSSNISGNMRLDLYCDLPSPHKVGTITGNTSVSSGKYTWVAGKYLGGAVTVHGKGYRIVAKPSDLPSITRSSAQFNLVAASSRQMPVSPTSAGIKLLSFIYPRRGDGFHKGIRYTISWQSLNLKDAKLKLELLDNQEQTVLQTIASNFANTGKMDWYVPMTLPDEGKFYKIRIQTMDGLHKASVGPIKVSKGAVLPASLKVTHPISVDKTYGDITPVRWTSTAACSGNGGPLDAGFRIELWNEYGTAKVMDLTDTGPVFDNESPSGYLNWHWDWELVRGSCPIGKYTVKVTSMIAADACNGKSAKFRIVDPASIKEAELFADYANKKKCKAEIYDTGDDPPTCPEFPEVPAGQGQVGSSSEYRDLGGSVFASEHKSSYTEFRSKMEFPGLSFQHIRNRIVKKATLSLENTMTKAAGGYGGFCAGHLYVLSGPWDKLLDMPVRPGFDVAIPNYPQGAVKIDVTSIVKGWMSGSIPKFGFLLTNLRVLPVQACDDWCMNRCWSYYKAKLKLEFQ